MKYFYDRNQHDDLEIIKTRFYQLIKKKMPVCRCNGLQNMKK